MLGKEGMEEESKGESFIIISCPVVLFLLATFSSFLVFFFSTVRLHLTSCGGDRMLSLGSLSLDISSSQCCSPCMYIGLLVMLSKAAE